WQPAGPVPGHHLPENTRPMSTTHLPRLRSVLLLAAMAAWTGCSDNDSRDAFAPADGPPVSPLAVRLEAPSATAPPRSQIALAIPGPAGSGRTLAAMQGTLTFDASRMSYVGHSTSSFQIVNANRASSGELRIASLDAKGLPSRTAVLVFKVKQAGYLTGLQYAFQEAGTVDPEQVFYKATVSSLAGGDVALPSEVAQLTLAQWEVRLAGDLYNSSKGVKPSFAPGSIVNNLKYGDADLSGSVNILDALDVANTSVGTNPLIQGTDAPNKDRVVAA